VNRPESTLIGDLYECNPVKADMVVANASNWLFLGTGLSNGDHLDDQGSQSLGGAIDRCRQTGWPRTDDDEVETALGKAVDGQTEVLRQHTRRRVAQDRAGGDHDRQLPRCDGELAQEAFDGSVSVGIKPLVGDAVAGQKLPDPERLGRETGTHDADSCCCAAQQHRPAGEKGSEDCVAQDRVRRDHVLQRSPRHHEDLPRLDDAPGGVRKIGILGMDLGYYKETSYRETQYYNELKEMLGEANIAEGFIHIHNPYLNKEFFTDPAYYWYRSVFLEMAEQAAADGVQTFNCSGGGILFGPGIEFVSFPEFVAATR